MKDPYVYEDTGVLKNKLGIKNYDELVKAESDISFAKLLTVDRDVDCNEFGIDYLKNIHKYILDDIYDWAGEFRTVPMEKPERVLDGQSVEYAYPTEILEKTKHALHKLNAINWNAQQLDDKAMNFSKLIAELWQVHPFRDGNTRTITTFAFRFADERGFGMQRSLLLDHFTYVRDSLVMASLGEYSEYNYLYRIVKDGIQRGAKDREARKMKYREANDIKTKDIKSERDNINR